jgi:hypothetical protein
MQQDTAARPQPGISAQARYASPTQVTPDSHHAVGLVTAISGTRIPELARSTSGCGDTSSVLNVSQVDAMLSRSDAARSGPGTGNTPAFGLARS